MAADSLAVRVADRYNNPVPNVEVTWAASGGGSVAPAASRTDPSGVAKAGWTLGGAAGGQGASAIAAGLPPVAFTATVGAGAAARVTIMPRELRFNALGRQSTVTVSAVDAFGNAIEGAPAVLVSLNAAVASLEAEATVQARANGTTRLVATVQGVSDTIAVHVQQIAASIAVAPGQASLVVGDTVPLTAVARDAGGSVIAAPVLRFTSRFGRVTVSEVGLVRAVSAGIDTVVVYADSATGKVGFTARAPFAASQVSIGSLRSCALDLEGKAYCWGRSLPEDVLGTGTAPDTCRNGVPCFAYPAAVSGGLSFTALSTGSGFTCALDSHGAAHCWGRNEAGQLGTGDTQSRSSPARVAGGLSFTSISAGANHACGLTAYPGPAYCWGSGLAGALGTGTEEMRTTPTPVAGGLTFYSISAGTHQTCGLIAQTRYAYCWGRNNDGQLGDGTTTDRATPTRVAAGAIWFTEISGGTGTTCALTAHGSTYCWGSNANGALGNGSTAAYSVTPVAVEGSLSFKSIDVGQWRVCAFRTLDGSAYCWGVLTTNTRGGVASISRVPVAVTSPAGFSTISVGGHTTCGVDRDGRAQCWGENGYGQLGNGSSTSTAAPTFVLNR